MSDDFKWDPVSEPTTHTAPETDVSAAIAEAMPQFVDGKQAPQYQHPQQSIPQTPPQPEYTPSYGAYQSPTQPTSPYGQSGPAVPPPPGYRPPVTGQYQSPAQPAPPRQPGYTQNPYVTPGQPPMYQPYQQPTPPYQQGYVPQPPAEAPGKGFGIASLILGICSLVLCAAFPLAILGGIVAIVLGIIALVKGNRGLSIGGIVTGAIGFVAAIFIAWIFGMVFQEIVNDPYLEGFWEDPYGYYEDWYLSDSNAPETLSLEELVDRLGDR